MRKLIVLFSVFVIASAAPPAQAHAYLDHANPPVGGTVQTSPHELTLWFTQNLEPAFSTVEVLDAGGARVDDGKAQISTNVMRVNLKPLPPGSYQVHWQALSVDTHKTQGSFTFRVGGS